MSSYQYLFIGGDLDGNRFSGGLLAFQTDYYHDPCAPKSLMDAARKYHSGDRSVQRYRKEIFGDLLADGHACFVLESMTRQQALNRISA